MERITWQDCVDLSREILYSPPGNWTHDIPEGLARFERRVILPSGHKKVLFRGENYAGEWPEEEWDRLAKPREPDPVQLELF
ncbi:hypothetical protein J41TS12_10910 [Paenibacillus antibioticophila]|uniref:Uncharacterized protein n=1 Tax=Paenibacillus antibioticophila TaxID=1274374 RepID=A0A919XTP0_9BACL|nr:hypothetical protein [Paenibacillus antibioticophila]GIO36230.1 hypothetical protein J41TS12_10910 [Paenibacillus antibioticophila]